MLAMPSMALARLSHGFEPWNDAQAPYPMMPAASTPTATKSAIGPQARPWVTLTGVTGLRGPLPPARGEPAGLPEPALAPDAGRPAAGFLPVLTTVGRRSGPPGVLMLIVPRQVGRSGEWRAG